MPDGKGGMQLVHMPMMPPGWTPEDMVEVGVAAEGTTDGTGHAEQSGGDGEGLSIGASPNEEVAEDAVAEPLENGTAE